MNAYMVDGNKIRCFIVSEMKLLIGIRGAVRRVSQMTAARDQVTNLLFPRISKLFINNVH